jgi:hypothetical protein
MLPWRRDATPLAHGSAPTTMGSLSARAVRLTLSASRWQQFCLGDRTTHRDVGTIPSSGARRLSDSQSSDDPKSDGL